VFNVGPVELMVILVLALIVFGPEKLPELMAGVGRAIREFQNASAELTEVFRETQREFTSVVQETGQDVASAVDRGGAAPAPAAASGRTDEQPVPPAAPARATVPHEYETAAALAEPAAPFVAPERNEVPPVAAVPGAFRTVPGPVDGVAPADAGHADPGPSAAVPPPDPDKPRRTTPGPALGEHVPASRSAARGAVQRPP
jgi:TatA/E family protein of Tat protein translocase